MARINIDTKFCKGCGLCTLACPANILQLDAQSITAKGYHPAKVTGMQKCTGCASCATMCPDVAIEVFR